MESTPPRRRRRSRSRSVLSVRSDGLELQAWTPLSVASSAAVEQGASPSLAVEQSAVEQGAAPSGAVEQSAVQQGAAPSGAVERSAVEQGAAFLGAVERSAVEQGAAFLGAVEGSAVEQGAAPLGAVEQGATSSSASLETPAVLATLAKSHGAEGLPVTLGLVSLRVRQLPAVILPCTFPSLVAEEKFYKAIIAAAGLTSSAKTLHGLQARAFEACCNLARQEADVLRACGMHDNADVWLKAVARAGAARRNISNFGRAFRLSDLRRSEQATAPRQTVLHFAALPPPPPPAFVAAVERDLVDAAGRMPEQCFPDVLLDALQYLSGHELVWLSREQVERQVTAEVSEVLDEVLGALLSLGLVRVSGDGQIRLEPKALQ